MKSSAELINQDSGDVEYYSPLDIIKIARWVMGGIDLDPFSSPAANIRVQATRFYTFDDDGLSLPWQGRVWMNHPFSRTMNRRCIEKLVKEYKIGNVTEACAITFASTSEAWFRPLLERPQCYLQPRTNYYRPDGSLKRGVTKGSVVTYFGKNEALFAEAFKNRGVIKIDYMADLWRQGEAFRAVLDKAGPQELAVEF